MWFEIVLNSDKHKILLQKAFKVGNILLASRRQNKNAAQEGVNKIICLTNEAWSPEVS